MNKHTSGPWEPLRRTEGVGPDYLIWADADQRKVATVHHYGNHEPSQANAMLIAAAPKMLEALQNIAGPACENYTAALGSCQKYGRSADAEYGAEKCCASCIANEAIEKATGIKP